MCCWGGEQALKAKTLWGLCWLLEGKQALTRLLGQRLCVEGIWNVVKSIFRLCIAGAFTKFAIFENLIFFWNDVQLSEKRITDFRFFTVFIYTIEWQSALCAAGRQTSSDEAKNLRGLCGGSWGENKPGRGCWGKASVGSVGCWRNLKWPYNYFLVMYCGRVYYFCNFRKPHFFETSCSWVKKRITIFRVFSVFIYNIGNNKVLCVLLGGEQALKRQRLCGGSVGCWRGNEPWRGCLGKGSVLRGSEMSSKPFLGYVLRARLLNSQFSKTVFFLKRGATEWKKGLRISVFSPFLYITLEITSNAAAKVSGLT